MQYYNEQTIDGYNDQIMKFEKEQTNLMKHLRAFKKNVNYLVPMKEKELTYYGNFANFLESYEEGAEKINEAVPSQRYIPMRFVTGEGNDGVK